MKEWGEPVTSLDFIWQYQNDGDIWVEFSHMSIPRHDLGACAIGKIISLINKQYAKSNMQDWMRVLQSDPKSKVLTS